MMAEETRLFYDHRALGLMLCWSGPQSHKRIGRSIRSLDHDVWEREREHAVLAGTLRRFCKTQR